MKKSEFKESFRELLDNNIEDLTFEEKFSYAKKILIDYEIEYTLHDTSNKGNKWTDYELEIILSNSGTKANCLKFAKLFKRGYGSIEQIYRWASTPISNMTEERKNDSFILQIKKVSKKIGLRN